MATVEQLERIAKLSEALAPLAGKQRGMRIEADDWNALVAAVKGILEVDRAHRSLDGVADEHVPAALLAGCGADVVLSPG